MNNAVHLKKKFIVATDIRLVEKRNRKKKT